MSAAGGLHIGLIGGIGVGISSVAAPTYISEIAPAKHRGALVGLYQFNIVFGILMAFVSNFVLGSLLGEDFVELFEDEAPVDLINAVMSYLRSALMLNSLMDLQYCPI